MIWLSGVRNSWRSLAESSRSGAAGGGGEGGSATIPSLRDGPGAGFPLRFEQHADLPGQLLAAERALLEDLLDVAVQAQPVRRRHVAGRHHDDRHVAPLLPL